jgi:hypothetical protein
MNATEWREWAEKRMDEGFWGLAILALGIALEMEQRERHRRR